jgi:hypothetical protein
MPFHWVPTWTRKHYEPSWLAHTGVVIHLGHSVQKCPCVDTGSANNLFQYDTKDGWEADQNYQDSLDILDTTPDEDLLVEEPDITQTETQDSNQTDPSVSCPPLLVSFV